MLRLYTDESPGLKVDPMVILFLSLGFIFSVVALHRMLKVDLEEIVLLTLTFLQLLPRSPRGSRKGQMDRVLLRLVAEWRSRQKASWVTTRNATCTLFWVDQRGP